jgi:DNA-binding transcriptional regulator LsrR (DeoR family)
MGTSSDRPYAEPMSMNEVEAYLYEAIATLGYIGHPVTRTEIAAVADLDDSTVDRTLRDLTDQGFLVQGDHGGQPAYEPARRD